MIGAVESIRQPDAALAAELESLLAAAKTGELRGLLFVAYRNGSDVQRFGSVGEYSLADFALALKLMELEFDSIVTRAPERT